MKSVEINVIYSWIQEAFDDIPEVMVVKYFMT